MYLVYLEKKICFYYFDGNMEVIKIFLNENYCYLFFFYLYIIVVIIKK